MLLGWAVVVGLLAIVNLAGTPLPLVGDALGGALSGGTTGALIALALGTLYRRIGLPGSPRRLWAAALAASLLGAIVWFGIDESIGAVLSPIDGAPPAGDPSLPLDDVPSLVGIPWAYIAQQVLLYFFILAAFHGVAISQRDLARAASAERLAQAARLDALRYQLNPHFLFNALNSAIAMIDEAPGRAQTMLRRLSGLLRDTLRDSARTTLREELSIVRRYLEIEQMRFEDKLQFHDEVSASAEACLVPPLLVHALVENAVKHGMRSSAMPLRIWLSA